MKTKPLLFLDGALLPTTKFLEDYLTPGHLKGWGVFETMRASRGHILALERHLARLAKGFKFFNLRPPLSLKKIRYYLKKILKINGFNNARVRLLVWQDLWLIHIAIIALPYSPPSVLKYKKGFKVAVAKQRCLSSARKANVKSIQYQPYLKACQEAVREGYDEAILLDTKGYLSEGSRSNLFFAKDGKLYTPDLRCGCLNGITRDIVYHLAQKRRIATNFVLARLKDLQEADEAFLTNSLMGIMPLTTLSRDKIGRGKIGSITKLLRQE